jgi:hypothetical protein
MTFGEAKGTRITPPEYHGLDYKLPEPTQARKYTWCGEADEVMIS